MEIAMDELAWQNELRPLLAGWFIDLDPLIDMVLFPAWAAGWDKSFWLSLS